MSYVLFISGLETVWSYLVHEPKQILVPPEVAKVIIHFLKALVIHNKKVCDSKLTFAAWGCHVTWKLPPCAVVDSTTKVAVCCEYAMYLVQPRENKSVIIWLQL